MNAFDALVRLGMPLVPRTILKQFGRRYLAGETLEEMLGVVRRLNREGMMATVDVLGEFITRPEEAREAGQLYGDALSAIAREGLDANISVKLSQMGLLLDKALCMEIMTDLAAKAAECGNFIRIDMEDSSCTTDTIALYLALRERFNNVGIVLQAALRRTMTDTHAIIRAGAGHFRLCKGIYRESRHVAFQDADLINRNYTQVLEEMLHHGAYVGIATHHETLVWEAERLIEREGLSRNDYEFQMLLGVDEELQRIILDAGHRLRIYVPFGRQWHAYCTRRLRENPTIARHVLKALLSRAPSPDPRQKDW